MGLFDIFRRKNEVVNNVPPVNVGSNYEPIVDEYGDGIGEFLVEDVFSITGRGTVVTGRVINGTFRVGDNVRIPEMGINTTITGIEMFRRIIDRAVAGDNVGLLLSSVNKNQVQRGNKIIK